MTPSARHRPIDPLVAVAFAALLLGVVQPLLPPTVRPGRPITTLLEATP